MKRNLIESFGIKESGITSLIEDLFTISTINITNSDIFEKVVLPQRLDGIVICICQRGEMEIMIESRIYRVAIDDMLVILPHSIFQLLWVSDDIELYTMGTHSDFINSAELNFSISLFISVREHPCISLEQDDKKTVLELGEMLKVKSQRERTPHFKDIAKSLMLAISYEISTIYLKRKPIEQRPNKRSDKLFLDFIRLVNENCNRERNLQFYASQMCITPKYLSFVVLSSSGKASKKWLSEAVIINAKSLLKSKMTVNQISDHLNFPNPSFFCQYFKKHTGVTPKSLQANMRLEVQES